MSLSRESLKKELLSGFWSFCEAAEEGAWFVACVGPEPIRIPHETLLLQATSSGVSPFTAPSASVPVASQNASTARSLQGSSSSAQLPPGSTPFTAAMSQMAATTRSLQSHWQAMLKQQGQAVPVEELLDRRMFGNASNETSLMASPVESGLSVSIPACSLMVSCFLPL